MTFPNEAWAESLEEFFKKHEEKLVILNHIVEGVDGAQIVFMYEGPIVRYKTSVYTTIDITIENGKVLCNRKEVTSLSDPTDIIEKVVAYIENNDGLRPDIHTM